MQPPAWEHGPGPQPLSWACPPPHTPFPRRRAKSSHWGFSHVTHLTLNFVLSAAYRHLQFKLLPSLQTQHFQNKTYFYLEILFPFSFCISFKVSTIATVLLIKISGVILAWLPLFPIFIQLSVPNGSFFSKNVSSFVAVLSHHFLGTSPPPPWYSSSCCSWLWYPFLSITLTL